MISVRLQQPGTLTAANRPVGESRAELCWKIYSGRVDSDASQITPTEIPMDRTDTRPDAFETELRAEAVGFARHGWPVVPGSYPSATAESVPVHPNWSELAGADPDRVGALWSGNPFTVLLVTGLGVDVLELPAELGRGTAMGLRVVGLQVPIAAMPGGRWLFPVVGGGVLARELADDPEVALHTEDDWVPLPPSPCWQGRVHWRVKPALCGWQLPRLEDVVETVPDVGTQALVRSGRS